MTAREKELWARATTYTESDFGSKVCLGDKSIPLSEIKEMSDAFNALAKIRKSQKRRRQMSELTTDNQINT